MRPLLRCVGLGLLVGAVVHGTAEAQVRPRPDSTRADSVARARADSIRADSLRREDIAIILAQRRLGDSVKAPTPASEMPLVLELGNVLVYDRRSLFATGALTLGDLLEGIPGLTVFRSGWIGSPEQAAVAGDFGSLRIFYDGLEMEPMDPRNGGTTDLSTVQLWPLEEVRIERVAGEVRVHLRTWRETNVNPRTRVDVGTGDLETNGYRGYFGRRLPSGYALQFGGFQYTSRGPVAIGDATQLSLFSRLGWAKGRFGVDVALQRTGRERTEQVRLPSSDRPDLRPIDATFSDLYVRGAFADTGSGIWAQVMAAQLSHAQSAIIETEETQADTTTDSTAYSTTHSQYVAAGGWSRGPLSISATGRVRGIEGTHKLTTVLRAGFDLARVGVSLVAEDRQAADVRRFDATVRVYPVRFLAISGSASSTTAGQRAAQAGGLALRGEVGLRLGRTWIIAGLTTRDTIRSIAPVVFDTGFVPVTSGRATARYLGIRGKFWRDVGLDIAATQWDSASAYRPEYQVRSRLYLDTDMRNRYPSGNLSILFAVQHEYRSRAFFNLIDENAGATTPPLQSSEYRTIGVLLEIRLLQATLSYQFRNVLDENYQQVPGYRAVRPVQYYGVRWNFFN